MSANDEELLDWLDGSAKEEPKGKAKAGTGAGAKRQTKAPAAAEDDLDWLGGGEEEEPKAKPKAAQAPKRAAKPAEPAEEEEDLGWLGADEEEEAPKAKKPAAAPAKKPAKGGEDEEEFQDALDWLQESEGGKTAVAPARRGGAEGEEGEERAGLDWLGDGEEGAPAVVGDDEEESDQQQSIFSVALDDFFEDMEGTEQAGGGGGGSTATSEADATIVTGKKKKRRTGDDQKIDRVFNTLVRYLTREEPVRESQLDTVFRLSLGKIVDPISAEVIVVYFLDDKGAATFGHLFYSRALFRNHPGLEEKFNSKLESLGKIKIDPGAGIVGRAVTGKKSITSLDASADPDFLDHLGKATGYRVRTMLTIPIQDKVTAANGEVKHFVYGAIQVMNKDPQSGEEFFSYQDLKLMETLGAYLGRLMHLVKEPGLERTEEEIVGYYAQMAKTEVVDPTDAKTFEWDKPLWDLVGLETIKKYRILPVKTVKAKGVQVVMHNPLDVTKRSAFEASTDLRIEEALAATESKISAVLEQQLGLAKQSSSMSSDDMMKLIGSLADEEGAEEKGPETADGEAAGDGENDSGLIKIVNQIIEQAYVRGVSDIHIEPHPEKDTLIRYRIDGSCQNFTMIPRRFAKAVLSRIKIMADLDIAERRKPQDGKIKFKKYGKLDIELRVATLPTVGGMEDAVMRILAASKPIPLDNMGFLPEKLEAFKKIIVQPYGLCLVVGPTGSGKTTTLHSALAQINDSETKIWTAEDPVEITQYGLRQVQVLPKIGFTFEAALRSFLRADPDVIMIGEMRDRETAEAGIEASLTGHMVFSTLHTNSAPETVTRLLDMEIDPYSFGDSLLGVCAQRLLRKLCGNCKQKDEVTEEGLAALKKEFDNDPAWDRFVTPEKDKITLTKKNEAGCAKCGKSGYKGRMGIHELMSCSDEMRALIYRHAKVSEMRTQALSEGMTTLKQDGIRKVLQGHTDIFEVRKVCIK